MTQEKNQYKPLISIAWYENDKVKTGYWEEEQKYWSNLDIISGIDKGYYNDGKKHGLWQMYSIEGNLIRESTFKDGKQVGKQRCWYPDTGILGISGQYNDSNQKEGKWTWFHKNGTARTIAFYDDKERRTVQQEFLLSGSFYKETLFIR